MAQRFTDAYIKALAAKRERYDVREGNGFGIRVFPSGEKSWFFIYHHLRQKRRMTLGNYPALSLQEARKECDKARGVLAPWGRPGRGKASRARGAAGGRRGRA